MPSNTRELRTTRWVALAAVVVALTAGALAVWAFSGVQLVADSSTLGRVELQMFAGSLVSVQARSSDGQGIPLVVSHGRLTPRTRVAPGERISLAVVVRRPGWASWALGSQRRETLTVRAPVAHVLNRWPTVAHGARLQVRYDTAVDRVSLAGATVAARTVSLPTRAAAGSVTIAAAARPWETLGNPVRITWFPRTNRPVVLASPAPNHRISPLAPITLTFSMPVAHVLGGRQPTIVPTVAGRWSTPDDHTLVFQPSGSGAPFNSTLTIRFASAVALAGATGSGVHTTTRLHLSVAPASFLRLQQLLAEEGYLPLDWSPAQTDAAHTMRSELAAAVAAPAGSFHWRYPNTPPELQSLWKPGEPNEIVRGAVMMFQDEHHLPVDGIAGPKVWHAVLVDAVAGVRRTAGYSYVYVHRNVPQLLTLWHNGRVVLTSPGNTGVAAAPTALGTWPVFEHIPVGRMSGTNPDGSHYNDPGIRWISYFHGGEALHAFNRASFGTPQSLGCVELPLDEAAKVWPYTPIGTLVTIES
jgi:peptidoglycan hydrolase-like protein with peptidoglycan-binding domain